MLLPNYELVARIGESRRAVIYEGYTKRKPRRMLALKLLKAPCPNRERPISSSA